MKPCTFEKLIECIFSTSIDNTGTNNKYFYIFSFYSKYLLFYIFYILILCKRNSAGIIAILKKGVLYGFLFDLVLLIWILLPFFCVTFFWLFWLFWFNLWRWFYISSILNRWGSYLYFNLFRSITPNHYITDKYEDFIIFEWLLNSFDSKVYVTDLSLINIIDIYFTFFNSLLTEKLRLFSF